MPSITSLFFWVLQLHCMDVAVEPWRFGVTAAMRIVITTVDQDCSQKATTAGPVPEART